MMMRFLFGGSLKKMTRQQWEFIVWLTLLSVASGGLVSLLVTIGVMA